ncbi:hypothetical protein DFS34DRAFT_160908 [Phlyctochytrium arcticum]|nr:hypothetical protein DFS34DRAFT_160908 [Phlyctochytrium arcticum]
MSRPEVIAAELRAAAGVGKGISRTSSLEPVDGNSPRMTRSTSRPLLIPDLSAEKALAVSDPLAAIRSLRSKLRNSPAQDPELEDLEKQLAAEREKNRSDRERRRQDHKKLHVDRRATISTWNNKIGESMAKLKQWERDSQIRIMQRESERELDREKYQTDRKLEMEKRRRTVRRRQVSLWLLVYSGLLHGWVGEAGYEGKVSDAKRRRDW